MDFTVTLPNGSPQSYSGEDSRYTVDEESGVLTVTVGTRRWRYSPAGWQCVEDSFGDPVPPAGSGVRPA
jgi:hypothetical protein